jgi:hypothetical protein
MFGADIPPVMPLMHGNRTSYDASGRGRPYVCPYTLPVLLPVDGLLVAVLNVL